MKRRSFLRRLAAALGLVPLVAPAESVEEPVYFFDWDKSETNYPGGLVYGRNSAFVYCDGVEMAYHHPIVRCRTGADGFVEYVITGPDGRPLIDKERFEMVTRTVCGYVRYIPRATA